MTRMNVRMQPGQPINQWFLANNVERLPGVDDITYRTYDGSLYGYVEGRCFFYSDSQKRWLSCPYGPL